MNFGAAGRSHRFRKLTSADFFFFTLSPSTPLGSEWMTATNGADVSVAPESCAGRKKNGRQWKCLTSPRYERPIHEDGVPLSKSAESTAGGGARKLANSGRKLADGSYDLTRSYRSIRLAANRLSCGRVGRLWQCKSHSFDQWIPLKCTLMDSPGRALFNIFWGQHNLVTHSAANCKQKSFKMAPPVTTRPFQWQFMTERFIQSNYTENTFDRPVQGLSIDIKIVEIWLELREINWVKVDSHEGFVEVADLLDVNVKLGVDVGLNGAVLTWDSHHRSHVLEIHGRLHFDLAHAAVSVTDLDHHRKSRCGQLKFHENETFDSIICYHNSIALETLYNFVIGSEVIGWSVRPQFHEIRAWVHSFSGPSRVCGTLATERFVWSDRTQKNFCRTFNELSIELSDH